LPVFSILDDLSNTSKMNKKFDSFYKKIIKFSKDELKNSKNKTKSLQSYIKKVENNAKSNIEIIDVLKAELKVSEIQTVIHKLYQQQLRKFTKELRDN